MTWLAKGHTAGNWQSQDLSPELAVPEVCHLGHRVLFPVVSQRYQLCLPGLVNYRNQPYCHLRKWQATGRSKGLCFGRIKRDSTRVVLNSGSGTMNTLQDSPGLSNLTKCPAYLCSLLKYLPPTLSPAVPPTPSPLPRLGPRPSKWPSNLCRTHLRSHPMSNPTLARCRGSSSQAPSGLQRPAVQTSTSGLILGVITCSQICFP